MTVQPPEEHRALDIGVYGARGIPSTYSGYETFLTALLPALAARGHRVTMYCRTGEIAGQGDYSGVRRVFLPCLSTKTLGTLTHGVVASIAARLARHDVVLTMNVANAPYCLLAKATGQPILLNVDGQEWLRGKWGNVARAYWRRAARVAGPCTSGLISDCNAMRSVYLSQFGSDSSVIPYCWPRFEGADEVDLQALFGLRPGEYIVTGGRLNPENHIYEIATAHAASSTTAALAVLGTANYDSPVQHDLDRLAGTDDRIRLLGHIDDRPTFGAILRKAQAYVHGHSVGGINPSLVEAMGSGARIVAFDTPFNREALGDGGTYFSDFSEELPRMIDALAAWPSEDAALRERAALRALQIFDLDAVADAYEQLLRTASTGPSRKRTVIPTVWLRS